MDEDMDYDTGASSTPQQPVIEQQLQQPMGVADGRRMLYASLPILTGVNYANSPVEIWFLFKIAQEAREATYHLRPRTSRKFARTFLSLGSYRPRKTSVLAWLPFEIIHRKITRTSRRILGFRRILAKCTRIYQACMLRGEVMVQKLSPPPWQRY